MFKNRVIKPKKTFKSKPKNFIKCHYCKKDGHMTKDCYHYKNSINDKNKENRQAQLATSQHGFSFMLKSVKPNTSVMDKLGFILDFEASDHLINDESLYADSMELEHPLKIAVAKQGEFIAWYCTVAQ